MRSPACTTFSSSSVSTRKQSAAWRRGKAITKIGNKNVPVSLREAAIQASENPVAVSKPLNEGVVAAFFKAVLELETRGYYTVPHFVLGETLWEELHRPTAGSEVRPRDGYGSRPMDEQDLRGNHEADNHIPEQVKRSAVFLAILSPGYAASPFCKLELDTLPASRRSAASHSSTCWRMASQARQYGRGKTLLGCGGGYLPESFIEHSGAVEAHSVDGRA